LEDFVSTLDPLEVEIYADFLTLPEIRYLDDYMHFEEQLRRMRARNDGRFVIERFSLESALLMRLNEYDEKVGLPLLEMPPVSEGHLT